MYWILPQRRELMPWELIVPTPNIGTWYPIGAPCILLAACWAMGRVTKDKLYKSFSYTYMAVWSVCLTQSLPIFPTHRVLRIFYIFAMLMYITPVVRNQALWTISIMHIAREPKITNLDELARSDLPMKFDSSMLTDLQTGLDAKSAEMVATKMVPAVLNETHDDIFGRNGTAVLVINVELAYIRNIDEVEKFGQVGSDRVG